MDTRELNRILDWEELQGQIGKLETTSPWRERCAALIGASKSLAYTVVVIAILLLVVVFGGGAFLSGTPGFFSGIYEDAFGNQYVHSGSGAGIVVIVFCYFALAGAVFVALPFALFSLIFALIHGQTARKHPGSTAPRFIKNWFCLAGATAEWQEMTEADGWYCLLESTKRRFGNRLNYSQHKALVRQKITEAANQKDFTIEYGSIEPCSNRITRFICKLRIEPWSGPPPIFITVSGELGRVGKRWYVATWRICRADSPTVLDEIEPQPRV